ncbi:uncharacterized protein LOC121242664 isoform X2 [Juglans microcarpa x Juglans regia]|uniref:uncharacterized protein LOC121242664 isoform X2 n=1 Tax=Juglans microcarpa x Juglans regia TaxID=2249226 RepID=UPI001B7F5F53|nr:uncharacterized protein LOC121242664 isoform X2 [Juglans microcarpa x Juglans regia]
MIFVKGILYQRQSTTFLLFCLKVYLNKEAPNFVENMSVATKYLKAVMQWHFLWRLSKTIEFHVPAIWQAVYSSSLFVLPMGVIKQVIHDFGGWGRVFELHSLRVFRPILNISVEFETTLITGNDTLSDMHIPFFFFCIFSEFKLLQSFFFSLFC